MEKSDQIKTDLALKGFEVIEELMPTFEGNFRFRITVRGVIRKGLKYSMVEDITYSKIKHTSIPYISCSRRNILEQILKEMKKQGEID